MTRSSDLPKTNPWVSFADYEVADAAKDEVLDIHEVSMKSLEEFIAQGVLTEEEVYEAESKAEKPRESVLRKYKPKNDDKK